MKKVVLLIFLILFFFVMPNSVLATSTYKVYTVDKAGTPTNEETFDNYTSAYNKMITYEASANLVAVIKKNDVIVNASYALAKSTGTSSDLIYLYTSENLSGEYTYITGRNTYLDMAFLEFNDTYNSVKIKISGFTGWVSLSNVNIIPISTISKTYVVVNNDNVYTNDGVLLDKNGAYEYDAITQSGEVKTYHLIGNLTISMNNYITNNVSGTNLTEKVIPKVYTYYTKTSSGKFWHAYYENTSVEYINLGAAPTMFLTNKNYYSFDGNYFYENYITMIDDYKNNTYENSINYTNPYYNYYMYLPTHSKTGYTATSFNQIIALSFSSNLLQSQSYYIDTATGAFTANSRVGISLLYGQGAYFIEAQETYGVNALLSFSAAINESATGTSALSFGKFNIFGHGANDGCVYTCANTYTSIRESILAHASTFGSGYSNPYDWRYFGSHYGNKGSGMNVKYASDPYWGEKAAGIAYNRDLMYGGQDYNSNTLGIKVSNTDTPIKKEPSDTSDTIYIIKNNSFSVPMVPFIVFDKVYDESNNAWYKVYTDTSLDDDQNISSSNYSFSKSYGYIKGEYLFVKNNQPTIIASNITIEQDTYYDFLTDVTASDTEDGNLSDKVTYYPELTTSNYGTFDLTYTVVDDNNFSVSKTIEVEITKTYKPKIVANNRQILQNTTFDPYFGVGAEDPTDGNITDQIDIISNDVDATTVGTYTVEYSVTNSLDLTTTKTVSIEVVSNAKPVIRTTNIYMKVNESLTYLEGVTASDLEDGIITEIEVTHNVNKTVAGTYDLTYSATDTDDNTTTKSIKVYVENTSYTTLTGELYFNKLEYNSDTNLLEINGSLAMIGINNTKDTLIQYSLILKNNTNGYEVVLPLERYLNDHPTTVYNDKSHTYTETWFRGNVSLKDVAKGEYTIYIRARSSNYETKEILSNLFLKDVTKKATDSDERGYLFRNNNYKKAFPIELFIYEKGLISKTEPEASSNMFNTYTSISFTGASLNITGNSFNLQGNYSSTTSITRYLILENTVTEEKFTYNIGSTIGEELILRTNDGLSKARSWFNTTGKVDLSTLSVGKYVIYFRTITGNIDDFGELHDLFRKATATVTVGNKKYSLSVNDQNRFRVELTVEEV